MSFNPPNGNKGVIVNPTTTVLQNPTADDFTSANDIARESDLNIVQAKTQSLSTETEGLGFYPSIESVNSQYESQNNTKLTGWYYNYIDFSNYSGGTGTIIFYLTDTQVTYSEGVSNQSQSASNFYNASFVSGYAVGDSVNIIDSYNCFSSGSITAIDGNKITVGSFNDFFKSCITTSGTNNGWIDGGQNNPDDYSLSVTSKDPDGGKILNNWTYTFGNDNTNRGQYAFVTGVGNTATGNYSFTAGQGLINGSYQGTVVGRWNIPYYDQSRLFTVGCGSWSDSNRKNAFEVLESGEVKVLDDFSVTGASSFGAITTTDDIDIGGELNTTGTASFPDVVVTDEVSAGSIVSSGGISGNNITASGSITGASLTTTGDIKDGDNNILSDVATTANGALQKSNNLSDLANTDTARTNLSVYSKIETNTAISTAVNPITNSVAALQVDKLNDGILYFNTGLVSKVGVGLPDFPFTFCTTINISAQLTLNFNILSIAGYDGATGQTLSITLKDNILTLMIRQTPTTTPAPYTSRRYTVSSDFWGVEHTMVWIARSLTSGTAPDWSLYIDGAEVTTTTYGTELTLDNITGTGKFGFGGQNASYPHSSPSPTPFTARNVRVFNFDLSATDAPYSLDDYHTGKAMPPTICDSTATQRAIIALDNYTIANGATKYVPDISGNSYDSAVTLGTGGYVKGTNDIRIAKLAQYINLQNA